MAGLNFTTVVWFLGPATLSAGQSVEFVIVYPGGGQVTSFNAIQTETALNQRFSYETTGIVIHGETEDAPPDDTTYFFTVTNESAFAGQFFAYWKRSTPDERNLDVNKRAAARLLLQGDHDDD